MNQIKFEGWKKRYKGHLSRKRNFYVIPDGFSGMTPDEVIKECKKLNARIHVNLLQMLQTPF